MSDPREHSPWAAIDERTRAVLQRIEGTAMRAERAENGETARDTRLAALDAAEAERDARWDTLDAAAEHLAQARDQLDRQHAEAAYREANDAFWLAENRMLDADEAMRRRGADDADVAEQ